MTDLSLSSVQQVLALINNDNIANNADLTSDLVDFANITTLVEGTKNTSVDVVSKTNTKYTGSVNVTYNRLDLTGFLSYGVSDIIVPENGGLSEAVAAFNAHYGANLALGADIVNDPEFPEIDYTGIIVDLVANESSLAYFGDVTVSLKYEQNPLSSIIVNTDLYGLNWPVMQGTPLQGTLQYIGNQSVNVASRHALVENNGVIARFAGYVTPSQYTLLYNAVTEEVVSGAIGVNQAIEHVYPTLVGNLLYFVNGSGSLVTLNLDTGTIVSLGSSGVPVTNTGTFLHHINGKIYIINGNTSRVYDISSGLFSDIEHFVLGGGQRSYFSSTIIDDEIYVFGGYPPASGGPTTTLVKYDAISNEWVVLTNAPVGLAKATITAIDGWLYLFGGDTSRSDNNPQNTLYRFDPNTNSWFTYPAITGWVDAVNRHSHGAVGYNGKLFIHGGQTGSSGSSRLNTLYIIS